jgi:hypothetical protein
VFHTHTQRRHAKQTTTGCETAYGSTNSHHSTRRITTHVPNVPARLGEQPTLAQFVQVALHVACGSIVQCPRGHWGSGVQRHLWQTKRELIRFAAAHPTATKQQPVSPGAARLHTGVEVGTHSFKYARMRGKLLRTNVDRPSTATRTSPRRARSLQKRANMMSEPRRFTAHNTKHVRRRPCRCLMFLIIVNVDELFRRVDLHPPPKTTVDATGDAGQGKSFCALATHRTANVTAFNISLEIVYVISPDYHEKSQKNVKTWAESWDPVMASCRQRRILTWLRHILRLRTCCCRVHTAIYLKFKQREPDCGRNFSKIALS